MRWRILIISLFICMITVGCSNTSTLTLEEKVDDFEQLYNEVKEGYPFLEVNKRLYKEDWLENKYEFKKRIEKTSSDEDFANELNSIMRELNNGHTEVITDASYFNMLKGVYESLGWYDFFDDKNLSHLYNDKEKSNGYGMGSGKDIELKDLVENKVGYMYIPQMNSASGSIDDDMKRISSYMEEIKDYRSLVIDIRGNMGGDDQYWIDLVSNISDKNYKCKGYRLFRNSSNVIENYTKARNVKLNNIDELPMLSNAPKEATNMFTHFEYNEEVVEGKAKDPFKGKIYLLVDSDVFSGAESFAIFCKEQKFATIIGSQTGGDGYVYDPVLFKLNNSGLIVRMSSTMYLTESGICDEEKKVTPDVAVNNTIRHGIRKMDACINKVLELENIQ